MSARLKILSYNIHKGFNLLRTSYVLKSIKTALLKADVDIVLLQEVVGANASYALENQLETLADTLWTHHAYGKNAIIADHHHGNAILSKYPIKITKNTLITNHKLEQRGVLYCHIEIPELKKDLHIYNTHLDLLHTNREKQIHKILDKVQKQNHSTKEPVIVAGDFNDWNQQLSHYLETHSFVEAHKTLHGHYCKTFPSFYPLWSLDRFYCRNMKVVHSQALKSKPWFSLSDHLPLVTTIEI